MLCRMCVILPCEITFGKRIETEKPISILTKFIMTNIIINEINVVVKQSEYWKTKYDMVFRIRSDHGSSWITKQYKYKYKMEELTYA